MGCFNTKKTVDIITINKISAGGGANGEVKNNNEKVKQEKNEKDKDRERRVSQLPKEQAQQSIPQPVKVKDQVSDQKPSTINQNTGKAEEDMKIANSNFVIEHKKENIKLYYKVLEKIGSGSFGKVYKVNHIPTNQLRAMKVISKETLQYQDDDKKFLKEIEILSQIDHPNILKVFEYYQDNENYYVITELCKGGELYEQIYELNHFSEKEAAIIMEQLLSAVMYIHAKGIVHRDLKPENILLENNKEKKNFYIKIIDFGTSNFFDKSTKLNLKVGTPYYIAPEVLMKSYTNRCDMWSCGVIMYILLTGTPPFNGNDEEEIMKNVLIGKYSMDTDEWLNISKEAKNLTQRLLTYDPEKRISAEDAWKHPWIYKYTKSNVQANTTEHKIPIENIKFFTSRKKFQQATIAFLVHQASTSEMMKELRKIFKDFDKNGDGRLSYDEIKTGFKMYYKNEQIADTEIQKLIENIDLDKNQYIEYEEFLRVTVNLDLLMTDKNLKMAFDFFDKDKSGKLTPDEIKKAICKDFEGKDNALIQDIVKEIDTNGDGQIEFNEFKQLMIKVIKQKM
jgi:calcium-dependent protein kinase